jgi:hypothetical protein
MTEQSAPREHAAPREPDWRLVVLGVVLLSAWYVWWHLHDGWIPFDDGTLAQSAERVLQGQLPHRDFDELYTGGLALLNAQAFRWLGMTLWTLRLVLFAVFVAWVPAVFYVASRFTRPLAAAAVSFLAVAWSLPNYVAAMPSWYNLFLATFGVAALFRQLDTNNKRWLFAAGVAGGLSVLVKIIGLYYVAGVLLFLVFHAHDVARSSARGDDSARGTGYATFASVSLLVFVAALWSVVRHQLHGPEVVQFVMPGALVAALLIRNEWSQPAGRSAERFAVLARLLVPFLAGVALPIALFLVPYLRDGMVGALANGVFVVPMRRFSVVSYPALRLTTMLALVPFALLVALAYRTRGPIGRRATTLLVIALLLVLLASGGNGALYRTVWYAARNLLPVLAVGGVMLLARDGTSPLRARTMLLLTVTALCSLVQLPYSAANYFCYAAPLVVLTALAVYSNLRPMGRTVPALLVAFFTMFAVTRTNYTQLQNLGFAYQPHWPLRPLALERGGINVPTMHADAYETLIPMLRAHARGGYTWASPDAPEIYFLSGLGNPTRTLFEIFDPTNSSERVLRALEARGVTAIVLNSLPSFSPEIAPDLFRQLSARYPHEEMVGPFQLRWRD